MPSVADFLVERLENAGIKHAFGVPGDFILSFFDKLSQSKKIQLVNNADESNAGFAADGYARSCGIGCVVVTYNVGALKICNPIAGAFAERSPVVVISGAPGTNERDLLMHHTVGSFECQREVFKNITCAQAILDDPTTAGFEIDKAFEALRYYKRPIYIELPRDIASKPIKYDVYTLGTPKSPETDMHNLEDALKEVVTWVEESKNPVILAGVEIARCGLGKELLRFAEKHNIPIASTLLSKSVINELHPLYIGVYAGTNSSKAHVINMVEESDCLLVCGEVITDATFGYRPSKALQKRDMVTCTVDELKVKNHNYPNVLFTDFCGALFKAELTKKDLPKLPAREEKVEFEAQPETKLTTKRLFEKVNSVLASKMAIIADTGDSMLGAADLVVEDNTFFAPAFYLSMGFAIPATLGAMVAQEDVRVITLVGDGAFQMSCSELSTICSMGLNPIVLVLNNHGYTTERMILEGPFNNIPNWDYEKITSLIGCGQGYRAETEEELEQAMDEAFKSKTLTVINCILDPKDVSSTLARISETLSKKVR